jgi:glycosyltransferase involved in cell wall biosynthesis
MRLFYCAFESIFDPVLESQVLVFLKKINEKLKARGDSIELVVFGSIGDLLKKEYFSRKKYIRSLLNGRCYFSFKFPYFYRFIILFRLSVFINIFISFLTIRLAAGLRRREVAVFHCRTEIVSYFILALKRFFYRKVKVICDCRGIGSEEILYKSRNKMSSISFKGIQKIEAFSHDNADYIFCVSKAFRNYIKSRTGKIKVIPCCLDTGRFKYDTKVRAKVRRDLGVGKRFAVLYSGSLNKWQLPAEMIKIFKIINKVIKNSLFIMFTKDTKYAGKLFSDAGIKRDSYILKEIPYRLISEYLQAGDLGLLVRQDNNVNRVAFPIKFFEYIRSGVPVLSSITSDVSGLIRKYELGFWLKDYRDELEIKKAALLIKSRIDHFKSDEYKMNLSAVIEKEMNWDSYLDSIINIYKNV